MEANEKRTVQVGDCLVNKETQDYENDVPLVIREFMDAPNRSQGNIVEIVFINGEHRVLPVTELLAHYEVVDFCDDVSEYIKERPN